VQGTTRLGIGSLGKIVLTLGCYSKVAQATP